MSSPASGHIGEPGRNYTGRPTKEMASKALAPNGVIWTVEHGTNKALEMIRAATAEEWSAHGSRTWHDSEHGAVRIVGGPK